MGVFEAFLHLDTQEGCAVPTAGCPGIESYLFPLISWRFIEDENRFFIEDLAKLTWKTPVKVFCVWRGAGVGGVGRVDESLTSISMISKIIHFLMT